MADVLYLNVYAVTRHYGGAAEGGWYYDRGEPLASVPVPAERHPGHGADCDQCAHARAGEKHAQTGQPYTFCRDLPEDFDARVEEEARELFRSQTMDERGPWRDLSEEEQEKYYEAAANLLSAAGREVSHLTPKGPVDDKIQELEALFAEEVCGNLSSVHGGVAVRVLQEDSFARPWPQSRPNYE